MDRREKIERIIGYYEVPSYRRTMSSIVAGMPLDWFTTEQLEDVARELVEKSRLTQAMNRRNREIAREKGVLSV